MPYAGSDFPVATAGEKIPYFFDFTNTLGVGETIISATWSAAVTVNSTVNDPTPSDILSGPAGITGNIVGQEFTNLIKGVKYLLTCTATTNTGNIQVSYTHLTIDGPV